MLLPVPLPQQVPGTVPLGRGWAQCVDLSPHPHRLGRNFDEVISCFANPPSETVLFSEARATIYEEEDAKVGVMPLLSAPPGGARMAVVLLVGFNWQVLLPEHP